MAWGTNAADYLKYEHVRLVLIPPTVMRRLGVTRFKDGEDPVFWQHLDMLLAMRSNSRQ